MNMIELKSKREAVNLFVALPSTTSLFVLNIISSLPGGVACVAAVLSMVPPMKAVRFLFPLWNSMESMMSAEVRE